MEKSMEALRHAQAKSAELEKQNKKLQEHVLSGKKEVARLKEELQVFKTKVRMCWDLEWVAQGFPFPEVDSPP